MMSFRKIMTISALVSCLLVMNMKYLSAEEIAGEEIVFAAHSNMFGGDVDYFTFKNHPADNCARVCIRSRICRAFVVTRHPVHNGAYECFLKDERLKPVASDCCDLGLIRRR